MDFHRRQVVRPYRSTVALADFLERNNALGKASEKQCVLDVAAGMGQVTYYLANRFATTHFHALELHPELVLQANNLLVTRHNASAAQGDLFTPPPNLRGSCAGVMLVNTLNGLDNAQGALKALTSLDARWIFISSLFHDGPVECDIIVRDYTKSTLTSDHTVCRYNVFSMPRVLETLSALGYADSVHEEFVIDIDLPEPADKGMGTFTVRDETGHRMQMSGPLNMPWRFLLARRSC